MKVVMNNKQFYRQACKIVALLADDMDTDESADLAVSIIDNLIKLRAMTDDDYEITITEDS